MVVALLGATTMAMSLGNSSDSDGVSTAPGSVTAAPLIGDSGLVLVFPRTST